MITNKFNLGFLNKNPLYLFAAILYYYICVVCCVYTYKHNMKTERRPEEGKRENKGRRRRYGDEDRENI